MAQRSPFCSQIQDGFVAALKHIFGLFGMSGRQCWDGWTWHLYSKQSWCRFPVSNLKKALALVDFLCVLVNFCQWYVCVREIQVLSTHVFIYSKMMRHAPKTEFWFILGTNILASHHIYIYIFVSFTSILFSGGCTARKVERNYGGSVICWGWIAIDCQPSLTSSHLFCNKQVGSNKMTQAFEGTNNSAM